MKTLRRFKAACAALALSLAIADSAIAQLSPEIQEYIDKIALRIADASGADGSGRAEAEAKLGLGTDHPEKAELDKRIQEALKVRKAVYKALEESKGAAPKAEHLAAGIKNAGLDPEDQFFVKQVTDRANAGAKLISEGVTFPSTAFNNSYIQQLSIASTITATPREKPLISPYDKPSERYKKARAAYLLSEEERAKALQGQSTNRDLILDTDELPFVSNVGVYVHAGVKLLSPYKLEPVDDPRPGNTGKQTAVLKPDGDAAVPFFEIAYANNWAWRDNRIHHTVADDKMGWMWGSDRVSAEKKGFDWFKDAFFPMSDIEFRFGYNGVSQKDDTKTIVGTGRLNLSGRISPILYCEETEGSAQAFTLDVGGGLITDASAYKTISNYYGGIGYTLQNLTFIHTRRPVLVRAHLGLMTTEVPDVDDNRYVNRAILEIDANGSEKFVAPRFKKRSGWAFSVEMMVPVSETLFLTLGGSTHRTKLNSYTTYIGITTNLQGIFDSLTK